MDSDKIEKQKYLVQEVIEKGYSPEDFTDYITAIREDGITFVIRLRS